MLLAAEAPNCEETAQPGQRGAPVNVNDTRGSPSPIQGQLFG